MLRCSRVLILSLSLAAFGAAQPVQSWDFESRAFTGSAYRGSGEVRLSNPGHESPQCLLVSGASQDAAVQAYSQSIPVTPGKTYDLDFFFKLSGTANVQVRWTQGALANGYVFNLSDTDRDWASFRARLSSKGATGLRYSRGLGKAEGRETALSSRLHFPDEVTSVQIYCIASGYFNFFVDDLRFAEVPAADAALQDEAARLLMAPKPGIQAGPSRPENVHLSNYLLAEHFDRVTTVFSERATNIVIQGHQFTRRGRPAFLLGVESSPVCYTWLYRLLDLDIIHLNEVYNVNTLRSRQQGDRVDVWWEPYEWLDIEIRQLLNQGLAPYVQLIETGTYPLEVYKMAPSLFVDTGHFISYRLEEPKGHALRENFWRSIIDTTRRYPIFAYEQFNEIRYMDYSPSNRIRFREHLRLKYGTIERANAAWQTNLASFEVVEPPRKPSAYGGTLDNMSPRGFSRHLWADWVKFTEELFSDYLARQRRFIKALDPNPASYVTVQAFCDLPMDYSGGGGLNPIGKLRGEDFYGDEAGGNAYYLQTGSENFAEIKTMLQGPMLYDLVSRLAGTKPVLDVECALVGYPRLPVEGSRVLDLHGDWKFMPDQGRQGHEKGWTQARFSDADWHRITVPGVWGKQGFPDCTYGWYRKRFSVPAALKGKSLYLNGAELADFADVFVNGTRVHQTKAWNERFGVPVNDLLVYGGENVIAVAVENRYRDNNMYWGGIRNYLSLDDRSYGGFAPATVAQMRSWLWEKMVHGKGGVIMSYGYAAEGGPISMFNPRRIMAEAIQAIPRTKCELEAAADLVLPTTRRPGEVALVFSLESGRYRVAENGQEWLRAPATRDLLVTYAGLLFNRIPTDVIPNDALLGEVPQKVVILRMCERAKPGTLEALRRFAERGGIVLIDHGSLMTDDDFNAPLPLDTLAGVRVGQVKNAGGTVSLPGLGLSAVRLATREYDQAAGRQVTLGGATALGTFNDGSPALTVRQVGAGYVYYLAAELPQDAAARLLAGLLAKHGIRPALQIGGQAPYVEAKLFQEGRRRLYYVHNWGMDARLTLADASVPDGTFTVRALASAAPLSKESWSAAELRQGIPLLAPCQDPIALLVEPREAPPTPIRRLDAKRERLLSAMRPSPTNRTRVLISAAKGEIISKVQMPTAVRLLEAHGFEVNLLLDDPKTEPTTFTDRIGKEPLASYQILVTLGSGPGGERRYKPEEVAAVSNFVARGGSLCVAGNMRVGPHGWLANRVKTPLLKPYGLEVLEDNVRDPRHYRGESDLFSIFTGIKPHPITTGVRRFQSQGMGVLKAPVASVLIESDQDALPPQAPVMAFSEDQRGRVLLMGDGKWLQPDLLAMDDNAQLCLNLFLWLARREGEIKALPPQALRELTEAELD